MLKTSSFLILLFFAFNITFSQGIDFKHITFEEALTQAKNQEKLIFIDFHTEWCGPCKKLAAGPFKEEKNGEFYNANFINLKLDAEKEGKDAAFRYQITAFPTLIFVDGDGNLVHQAVGIGPGNNMIGFGKEALNSATSKYSLEKLQIMFPNKQDDEAFLKLYFNKMEEFGINVSEGIDAWLKVQTEMTEKSPEMMQFLLRKQSNIELGSKAEEIFNTNYDYYLSISKGRQKMAIERYRNGIFLSSLKKARRTENANLMKIIIDRFQKYDDIKGKSDDNLNTYQLDYYRFSKQNDAFKRLAEKYVDSLINAESISDIKKKDANYYDFYSKGKEFGKDPLTDYMLALYKEGKKANKLVESITTVGHDYLDLIETKKENNTLNKWIKYCYKLIPHKYWVENLEADLLFKAGKTEKAINLKTSAINNMPFTVKKKVNYQHELNLMKESN